MPGANAALAMTAAETTDSRAAETEEGHECQFKDCLQQQQQ